MDGIILPDVGIGIGFRYINTADQHVSLGSR